MKPLELRSIQKKMYKRQKGHFQAQLASKKFYGSCIFGCYVIMHEKYKMPKNVA